MIPGALALVRRKPQQAATTDITAAYVTRTSDTTDATAYSWTAHSIGAEDPTRVVVVSIHGRAAANRTVSSVVIGGVTVPPESLVQTAASQHPAAIAYAAVPSGTTATIQVTFSGAMVRASIAVTTLTGPDSIVLVASATSTSSGAMVVAAVDGGAVVATGSTGFGGGSCSWSGVTEDYDATIESASMHSGGHAAITADGDVTVTPTWSATTNTPRNVAASFGPGAGDPAPTVTRDAYLWPFAVDAAFNTPVSQAATYESSSSPKTATWLAMFPALGQVNGGGGGYSVQPAKATTSDPLAVITTPVGVTPAVTWGSWRIPTTLTPPTGTDKSCTILQPDGTLLDCYKMVKVSDTHWTSTSVETQQVSGDGISAGIRAADVALLGGLIRQWHVAAVQAGDTRLARTALAVSIPKESLGGTSPYYVEPASGIDNQTYVPYSLKGSAAGIEMGTLFAIPDTTDVEAITGLSATWGKPLARTLQEYGAYVFDQSSTVALYAEPGISGTICDAIKADWKILGAYMRRVSSTNTAGAWGGGTAPRLAADAPPLA